MQDMTFIISMDRAVHELWDALGASEVNVEASNTYPSLEGRIVRVVVADDEADRASNVLFEAGFAAIDRHEVLIADIDNRPGQLGELARSIADAGAKLMTLYMAMGDRVVIGADDLDKVRKDLG
jgi:hypothetical protein